MLLVKLKLNTYDGWDTGVVEETGCSRTCLCTIRWKL